MAELKITDEEREAYSFLDWGDAALGKMCKYAALSIRDKVDCASFPTDGEYDVTIMGALLLLCSTITEARSNGAQWHLKGAWSGDDHIGDWVIDARQVDAPLTTEWCLGHGVLNKEFRVGEGDGRADIHSIELTDTTDGEFAFCMGNDLGYAFLVPVKSRRDVLRVLDLFRISQEDIDGAAGRNSGDTGVVQGPPGEGDSQSDVGCDGEGAEGAVG